LVPAKIDDGCETILGAWCACVSGRRDQLVHRGDRRFESAFLQQRVRRTPTRTGTTKSRDAGGVVFVPILHVMRRQSVRIIRSDPGIRRTDIATTISPVGNPPVEACLATSTTFPTGFQRRLKEDRSGSR
jgi:hypothetical protein